MNRTSVSRRRIVASAALVGGSLGASFGAAASDAPLDALQRGARLDLTNAADAVKVLARLHGNIAPGRPRFDWFDGTVSLVSAAGDLRTLCGIRGYSETYITPSAVGSGAGTGPDLTCRAWTCRRRVVAIYIDLDLGTDLHSRAALPTMQNPLTGAWVEPQGFTVETRYELSVQLPPVRWRLDGAAALMDETATDAASPLPGPAKTTRSVSMADIQNHDLTTVRDTGTWRVVTPWMPWLEMGQAQGHCVIDCLRGGGTVRLSELPAAIVNAFKDAPAA